MVDIDENVFKMADSLGKKNAIEYMNAKLRGKKWRLFILDTEGRQTIVTIMKSTKMN